VRIAVRLRAPSPVFSFEFFPPRDEAGMEQLFRTVADLESFGPDFVSVTWGAGGSTRRLTVELVRRIKRETGIETVAHLTCGGATRAELQDVLDQLAEGGIENVLPLRGDPPRGAGRFVPADGGFAHASELVAFIRAQPQRWRFCLAGACYPEKHPEAPDPETDLANLVRKVEAGVDFLITQLFFDADDYFGFVARARQAGIQVPILAGVMPITSLASIRRMTALCGARIPAELLARLERAGDDPEAVRAVGVEHAILQCRRLLLGGAPGIHFYTLNRSTATREILQAIR
jgi:methylenetetrahydrofolate reductase (NADPH)